jgi:tRNA modification GTPase
LARTHFRPAVSKPLPDAPPPYRFWFGTLAGDEVVLAVKSADRVEVHCHGGRLVVRRVMETLRRQETGDGRQEDEPNKAVLSPVSRLLTPEALLPFAPTLRTASILLDQCHGAFDWAVRHILQLLESSPPEAVEPLRKLASFAPIGRHLIEPWKVVVAGPPNVGKSSLVNALAGYQRSVVSDVAGTTRDAVGVRLAFDGWPVELIDTAGLRESEGLEAEGIALAERAAAEADLVLWVMDAGDPRGWTWHEGIGRRAVPVVNKSDLPPAWPKVAEGRPAVRVSATTGRAVPALAQSVVHGLVGLRPPLPGDPVPFTPQLADAVEAADTALSEGRLDEAAARLRDAKYNS